MKGRFAPSPSGRMHLGNVFAALMSWLSVRKSGGGWVLRIEDLDPQRSKKEYARLIEDDLSWLGLDWDEGGLSDTGPSGPYSQSRRGDYYQSALDRLSSMGLTYPCFCTRADIMATQAPHQSDGRVVYAGTCRPKVMTPGVAAAADSHPHAVRLMVPDETIEFEDGLFGLQSVNLATLCGDFVLRRADKEWAYQLAVVVDDALMGISEVVRGSDLLLSTAQQLYLYWLLGYEAPRFVHIPLLCNSDGRRLAKRDYAFNLGELRGKMSPEEIIGRIACLSGLIDEYQPCRAAELIPLFDWRKINRSLTCKVELQGLTA